MLRDIQAKREVDNELEAMRKDPYLTSTKLLRQETLHAASEALDYRVPKPVKNKTCPTCSWCGTPVPRHCPNCGQALELRL